MSLIEALRFAGIASCVVATLLFVLSAYAFVREDIPSVLDDLSGKKRQRALAQTHVGTRLAMTDEVRPQQVRAMAAYESSDVLTESDTQIDDRSSSMDAPAFEIVLSSMQCPVACAELVEGRAS